LIRFHPGESLSEGIDRVVARQFEIALAIRDEPAESQALAVHETRKAIKRLRAVLRLVRDSISHDSYHSDNALLKLVAAELSTVRDSWVMSQILGRLLPASNGTGVVTVVMDRLQERYRAESHALLENRAQMGSIVEQLEQVRSRSARWSQVPGERSVALPHEFVMIAPGLERVYKRGRRGMRIVADSPTDTLLHVWRKRTKYLRHQIEALNVLDPEGLHALETQLETLTDLLGDDHDLAVLLVRFDDDASLSSGVAVAGILDAVVEKRQELQADAITVGREIFARPASEFVAYLQGLWKDGDTF
jgi:CHAD domain-containing protein